MDLGETGWGLWSEWIKLAQDRGRWRAVVNTAMNLPILAPRWCCCCCCCACCSWMFNVLLCLLYACFDFYSYCFLVLTVTGFCSCRVQHVKIKNWIEFKIGSYIRVRPKRTQICQNGSVISRTNEPIKFNYVSIKSAEHFIAAMWVIQEPISLFLQVLGHSLWLNHESLYARAKTACRYWSHVYHCKNKVR
jgi:hypothetical protein